MFSVLRCFKESQFPIKTVCRYVNVNYLGSGWQPMIRGRILGGLAKRKTIM